MGTRRSIAILVTTILFAVALLGTGYRLGRKPQTTPDDPANAYPLLSRRIFADNPKDPLINFSILRTQLNDYYSKNALDGSLYFEYLPTGTEVRVNGDEKNAAASLLKVPLAMEFYKAIELGKIDPNKQITLREEQLDSAYGNLYKKGAGYNLTLMETAKLMLVDSDNTALKALADAMEGVLTDENSVFNYLDLAAQQQTDQSVIIGARSYSSILKCLYFACYLNKDDSQKVLDYLTQTSFTNRLVAGVPDKSIKIAHKIGVFRQKTQSDCGIIYLPNRPYILCIMIDGQDNDPTNKHIADLSKQVYDFVTKQQ